MLRILMICNLGVSTSFVKDRIVEAFKKKRKELDFKAQPRSSLEQIIEDIDLVLVAPQLAYLKEEIFQICAEHKKLCLVIPFTLYGNMDGEAISDLIEATLNQNKE